MPPPNVKNPTSESAMKLLLVEEAIPPSAKRAKPAIMIIPDLRLRRLIASRRDMRERPNENKMSDGGRERASLGVEGWKSSQNVDAERSGVRSIAWLDGSRGFTLCVL